jgi:hypothetical protein
MPESQNMLHHKLDEFIRKYYLNRLLQGLLLGLGGLTAFFILASVIEYFGNFGTIVRGILFFGFLVFAGFVFVSFILNPLLKWLKIGKVLSYEQASKLIGSHFPEISDKLLNTLQLQEQAGASGNELLIASIDQRIKNLNPFRFSTAINLGSSAKKYGKYTLVPLGLLFIILVFQSNIITKPVNRIMSYDQQFVKEAPFNFILKTKNLEVVKNSDILVEVETQGRDLPADVFVNMDKHLVKMEKTGRNVFSFTLPNLTANHRFFFTDGEYESVTYDIKVLPNPTLVNFKVNLTYPSYIGKKPETIQNIGDITLPQGTEVEWVFNTKDADRISFQLDGKMIEAIKTEDHFTVKKQISKTSNYHLQLQNKFVSKNDTIKYALQVVPDRYPGIVADQQVDSINPFIYYFYGKADDDYGISKLSFVYKKTGEDALKYLPVNIGRSTDEIFYYMVDLRTFVKNDGDDFEYYFEVWDNDGVNGKKSSKSQVFKAISPDQKELRADAENSSKSIKNKMQESMKEIQTLQKKTNELNKELMENDQLDWQQQQKIKDFIAEQKKLETKLEELKTENKARNEKEKQLNRQDEELLQKQKELEKLFNEIMTPELKELIKKLEEMMKEQNKEGVQNQLEKMKMNNEDMKKQLDRSLEQFKQLELEKNVNQQVDALKKLAEKQEELAKKTLEKSESAEELKKQQDDINKQFDDIKEELKKIEEKNKDLESPMNLEDTKKDQEQVDQSQEESSKNLEKKQNKKANENQKKSAEKMDEMAEKMKKSMEKSQEEQQEEDYYTLRQILENLIELSVQEENLMQQMRETKSYSPKFVELSAKQRKLKENAKMVEDSLLALSKRQVQIKSYVNKEITNINHYMDKSITHFSKVEIPSGVAQQQYVMTGLNNLAVMLSESLKQMQESMKEKKGKSSAQCNNPGKKPGQKSGNSGKPKMGGIKKMQEEIGKQMQQMKQGKQQGTTPSSEQFARIAAQQEALRREVERLEKMLKEGGKPGALGDLDKTKKLMEQQERDLVNKQITPETVKRMQDIETRLLEHEKAELEQDQDNTREAEQAKETNNDMPPAIKAYLAKKAREMELLRSVPGELSPYYKDRVRLYFKKVGNN